MKGRKRDSHATCLLRLTSQPNVVKKNSKGIEVMEQQEHVYGRMDATLMTISPQTFRMGDKNEEICFVFIFFLFKTHCLKKFHL